MKMYTMPHGGLRLIGRNAFAARPRAAGFTLIEMIAVLVLIGIVMAVVGGKVMQNFQNGEVKAGQAGVHSLEMKVQAYMLDNGGAPQSLHDLVTRPSSSNNWNGPYAKESDLKDPFQHPYFYKSPGDHGDFDIVFYGKDGKPGGDGLDKDFGNWQ